MAHGNYTVTSSQIVAEAGTQVNLTTPSVTLTITANEGYTVTHTDFSIGDALPSEVLSAVFSQNGSVVECLVTFADSFIMPSGNVNLPIDIDGTANPRQYTVSGTYIITEENTTDVSGTVVPFSGSGTYGQTVTLFTHNVVCDPGFRILTAPLYSFFRIVRSMLFTSRISYEISYVDTTDGFGNVISRLYTVNYTFGISNGTSDKLRLVTSTEAVYTPTVYIKGYKLNRTVLTYGAEYRAMRVFGDPGALLTLDVFDGIATTTNYATLEPIPAVGYLDFNLFFPAVLVDTDYTITLSGGYLDPGFFQSNPITLLAREGTTVIFNTLPLVGYTATLLEGNNTYTFKADALVPLENTFASIFYMKWKIEATDGSVIDLLREPLYTDFSNTLATTNGGTFLSIGTITTSGSGTTTIIIEVNASIKRYGDTDVFCNLDLSELFNHYPVAVDDIAAVAFGSTVLIDVTANDTDTDGQTLTPVIVTDPTYGTALVVGTNIYYTHDGTPNYEDSFTYQVSDGFQLSNIATVNVAVGIAPGDSLTLSGATGIFYIPVILGNGTGDFTVHFNAGAVPDRIELIYDGVVVADSLFIGDDLTGGGRAAAIAAVTAISSLDSFDYVGSNGDATGPGQPGAAWDVNTLGNVVSYADPADIAPTGNTRTDITSNFGAQVGVGNLVYTSISDEIGTTGLDSADGNASIKFTKSTALPIMATIKITGATSTGWNIYQTSFE